MTVGYVLSYLFAGSKGKAARDTLKVMDSYDSTIKGLRARIYLLEVMVEHLEKTADLENLKPSVKKLIRLQFHEHARMPVRAAVPYMENADTGKRMTRKEVEELFAVEIPRNAGGGPEPVVPHVTGQTVAARTKKAGSDPVQRWDEPQFQRALEQNKGSEARAVAEDLIAWCRDRGMEDSWDKAGKLGSYVPFVLQGKDRYVPFALWTDGVFETQFRQLKERPAFASAEIREQLRQRFNALPTVSIPPDGIERSLYFPIRVLSDPASMMSFKSTIDWMLDRPTDVGGLQVDGVREGLAARHAQLHGEGAARADLRGFDRTMKAIKWTLVGIGMWLLFSGFDELFLGEPGAGTIIWFGGAVVVFWLGVEL